MKIGIIYESITNNTELVAKAIQEALVENHEVVLETVEDVLESKNDLKDMDLLFLGSWTNRGTCGESMKKLASSLEDRQIILFGTAGFIGTREYLDKISMRFANEFSGSNEILGSYYCQGKMPDSVRSQYEALLQEHPMDRELEVRIEHFDEASDHPNKQDLKVAQEFTLDLVQGLTEE